MPNKPTSPKPLAKGDVAVVTGAAKRVGRAIGLALADDPQLDIVVHYGRSQTEADQIVDDIRQLGRRSLAVAADLRQPTAAAATVFEAAAELGPARLLVNCAAAFDDRKLADIDEEHWHHQFAINSLAPLMLSQQFAAQLPDGESGHIINLLDWRAIRPPDTHPVYSASKAALFSLTQSLAQQLAPAIQVNGIAPGAILPPPGRDDWHDQRAMDAIPLKRRGSPQDICNAVQYLAKSGFVTGEILHVSGGEHL